MRRIAPAELEGHAAKHQTQQHRDHERIRGGQDDGVCQREGREQASPAEHQPRFIAIPHGCDGIHGLIAFFADREHREEDADAQIEPIQQHVGKHREGDDSGPNDGKLAVNHGASAGLMPWAGVNPA